MRKKIVLIKKNGEMINNIEEVNIKALAQEHLCSNCAYSNPIACQKVADIFLNRTEEELEGTIYRPKQPIGEYPEITDGYQIIDEKNIVRRFVVTGCKNYKFIDKNASPKVKIEELNRIRDSLLDFYNAYECEGESAIKRRKRGKGNPNIDSKF